MDGAASGLTRRIAVWTALAVAIAVPVGAAAASPVLAWRNPIYIIAGFAGIGALALLLVQPLLAAGTLPGLSAANARRTHRITGGVLVAAVCIHVLGLWVTSPPDVVDALLFTAPTPFSVWGVIAMWAIFASWLMVGLRQRLQLRPRAWRLAHTILAGVIVVGSIVHALLIEGTMETLSKAALCVLVVAATVKVIAGRKVWAKSTP